MASPPIVLDSNAFRDKSFIYWLSSYHAEKIVPPIVYCELAVHFLSKNGDFAKLDGLLTGAGVRVARMDKNNAMCGAQFAVQGTEWEDHWRDYMIGAHAAYPPWRMITNNVRDFEPFLGVRVLTPTDFSDRVDKGELT